MKAIASIAAAHPPAGPAALASTDAGSFADRVARARERFAKDPSCGPGLLEELAALHPTARLVHASWVLAGNNPQAQAELLKAAFQPQRPWEGTPARSGGFLLERLGRPLVERVSNGCGGTTPREVSIHPERLAIGQMWLEELAGMRSSRDLADLARGLMEDLEQDAQGNPQLQARLGEDQATVAAAVLSAGSCGSAVELSALAAALEKALDRRTKTTWAVAAWRAWPGAWRDSPRGGPSPGRCAAWRASW